ncbi:MAG TPA: hypothetical protein VM578_06640 [Candidatus Saccharimonadales bacterium]|nr:hypothetical protein [Candidatus Saccharimonadales bacterium]
MSREREFINETFHLLAQPITALRATMELGLSKKLNEEESHQVLEDCLSVLDRLMLDVAVFREIASLEDAPELSCHDGHSLLHSCAEEMTIVADASNVELSLTFEPVVIQCNEPSLRRAMFVLLDEMIAAAPAGSKISVILRNRANAAVLEVHPGIPHGQREKLCLKLLQFAGASDIHLEADHASVDFRKGSYRQYRAITSADKQLLTSH